MFHLVYYAKSFNVSICLEAGCSTGGHVNVPPLPRSLEQMCIQNLAACLRVLSKVLTCFRQFGSHDADTYSSYYLADMGCVGYRFNVGWTLIFS